MQKPSTKYQEAKYSSIFKGLYTTTKWDLSLEYKGGSAQIKQTNKPH